jgi:tRNA-Thr(GGU) m(6)t(6)A37 methyltransferase TsaA
MEIKFKPIGIVKTHATADEIREKGAQAVGELEIYPEFEPALEGIDGYSHLFVLAYIDRLRPEQIGPLQVKPRGLLRKGFKLEELPLVGVFALDSPTRPNPIGLTLVRLIKREGNRLFVEGLDLFDGTPILDIKGYNQGYRAESYALPRWYSRFMDEKGRV